ncbi:allophanate hydrolase [Fibrobacter sp. UWH9]|uniref:allophanate hydrolase n=1 Tax=Fibrobacter sp. UWH9 TaxID=1896213 RepID=UPI00091FC63F|nr:allophanate hydrolase [Fibrobacter sp. UWH9]SHH41990.1 allophanate hydrolase [Fibrobacter sp. UWH9]
MAQKSFSVLDLRISSLRSAYEKGETSPREVVQKLRDAMEAAPREIWIAKTSKEQLEKYLTALESFAGSGNGFKIPADKPLFGIPFAIKDNIDCEGMESTSACPAYAYMPKKSAFVVERLIEAGAIPMGKTNMDQFATGLVGVRSPYGCIPNRYAPEYVSGGSSSGSAAALAYGLCSFSLGTDTAGSGRVPAAFNKLVGVKPTRGLLSTSGVIPACRSLDCVSIFALDNSDARYVLNIAGAEDSEDAYSRVAPWNEAAVNAKGTAVNARGDAPRLPENWTFGVPEESELNFFGNEGYKAAFYRAVEAFEKAGGTKVTIHFTPFLEAARLLYEGPWVFERYDAVGKFIEEHPDEIFPVTKQIISPKVTPHPSEVFAGFHALQAKKKIADREFAKVDVLLTPTAGTIYKTAEVNADPIRLNSNLGYYTNYMNLLDYSALAIPAGVADSTDPNAPKLPFGVTIVGHAFDDFKLLDVAEKVTPFLSEKIPLAVCGAHLKGEPLHYQLETADFLGAAETAAEYKMYAFKDGTIQKPAMIAGNSSFYVELYALTPEEFGKFVAAIPAPLGIGKIKLSDGRMVPGFIGDGSISVMAFEGTATDISEYGDWRKYVHK